MPNLPDPTLLAIPAFIFFVVLEWWAVKTRRANGEYETGDAITSMLMGTGSSVSGILFGFLAAAGALWIWQFRIAEMPINVWTGIAVFFAYDFFYYWKHRFMHRMRWWWADHTIHHSSNHYNLTTALRQPWTGPITGMFVMGAPLILLGAHPAFVGFVGALNLLYQFWIHTEAIDKCPRWFEAIFNTPSHHRAHHGRNPRYLDSNYAGVLIIWDRMFGTFVPEVEHDKPDYGLVTPLISRNPFWVATHEYWALLKDCASDGLRPDRWVRRIFGPPGWSPTGDHDGSAEAKAAYIAAHPDQAGLPGLPAPHATEILDPVA